MGSVFNCSIAVSRRNILLLEFRCLIRCVATDIIEGYIYKHIYSEHHIFSHAAVAYLPGNGWLKIGKCRGGRWIVFWRISAALSKFLVLRRSGKVVKFFTLIF